VSQRVVKVQKLAREVLGETIQTLKDPRIGFVTVTAVRISRDLQHARVFVSVLGDEDERAATMSGLISATPYLRSELGRQMKVKYVPELQFDLDTGPEEAQRLESLLKQIHEAEDQGRERDDYGEV
jgi:ribosome-binding factor A